MTRRPRICPFRHRKAAAVSTPSGAPPVPITACTPVPITAAEIPADKSPSPINRIRAPARRISSTSFSCRGRSNTITTKSSTSRSSRFAIAFRLSATGASRSTAPLHDGPTTIFSMYKSGACSSPPRSLAASTAMALGAPVAHRFVPSSGSTAMSTGGNSAFGACIASPTFSPMYSIGASSRSPSPITIVPSISTESIVLRMASTATSSAWCRSPYPIVRAAAIAAFSTTRKKSRLSCSSIRPSPEFPVPPAANHRPNVLTSSTTAMFWLRLRAKQFIYSPRTYCPEVFHDAQLARRFPLFVFIRGHQPRPVRPMLPQRPHRVLQEDQRVHHRILLQHRTRRSSSSQLLVPPPDAALHHIVGAPDVLDYTKDINAYLRLLAGKSPRVKVWSIGMSEEGREMLVAAVSDEANLSKLGRYKEITARLADPRGLNDAEAQKLLAEGKPIYWADGSIHSPETGSPEMLMELAYRLAVEDTPFIQKIRRDAIVLITPIVETDGHDRMVDIYMQHKKHPDQPPYPLIWWGHYVSHDNNRDNLGLSLALSRNMLKTFLDWHPTVMHDLHESVPYLYIMTGTGPYNAWLDPIVISEWQEMAYHEIEEMTRRGVIGVWTHGFYDGWAPNYLLSIANNHNSIGRFYETFGNGGADTRVRTLRPPDTSREWYRPNPPLPKVKWSARDNINMQESAILFGMNNLASNGQKFLNNFYLKSKRAVAKARTEGPAAWVFPADDPRPAEQASLLNLLELQGVEVHRLEKELRIPAAQSGQEAGSDKEKEKSGEKPEPAGKSKKKKNPADAVIPAGSYVIRMDQPYSRLADMALDTQYYSSRDPRSYDDTGWTLGALRNVKTTRVTDLSILGAAMQKMGRIDLPGGIEGTGKTFLIHHNTDNTLASFRFRLASVPMEAAEDSFEADGVKFKTGSFVIRNVDRAHLEKAAKELGIKIHSASGSLSVKTHALAVPRVALVHNWQNTQNDGWFRIPMDELKVPYTYVADTWLRESQYLREKFDVIILPPMGGGGPAGLST